MASSKISYLKFHFGLTYNRCKGHEIIDDRKLFVNMVDSLTRAIQEFESLDIKSAIIRVAFNDKFDKVVEEIKSLEVSLQERGMI